MKEYEKMGRLIRQSRETVQQVKQIDLLTYLRTHEPYELVYFSRNTYTTKTRLLYIEKKI